MFSIPAAYRRLRRAFGPQGWWPLTPRGASTPQYHPGRFPKLSEREKVEVAFGAILTQNTAWSNVVKALGPLRAAGALSLAGVLRLPRPRLERAIRSSGYFRQKAAKLKAFARAASRRGGLGRWLDGEDGAVSAELLGVHGIGPETADSILLYAGARSVFVVDAYTRRIGRRLGWLHTDDYESVRRVFERALPASVPDYQELHALLVELAKRHCRKSAPLCTTCPLQSDCRYAAAHSSSPRQGRGEGRVRGSRPLAAAVLLILTLLLQLPAHAAFYAAMGKEDITPDPKAHSVYLAGYGDKGRKAKGVHDPLYARALVVSDGKRAVGLVAVDVIGLFREDVAAIRGRLDLNPEKQALLVAATHTHSGPDTLGLWGPFLGISGVDAAYREYIHERVARLIKRLAGSLQEAEMFSSVRPIEMKGRCRDLRDPVVMNPDLAVLRFRNARDQSLIGTLVDWSCHPEVLGPDNDLASADFAGAACAAVEKRSLAPCAYFSGTIGGMQSPDNDALQAGGKDEFGAVAALGEILAREVEESAKSAERSVPDAVDFRSRTVRLTVENSKYLAFLPALAFGHRLYTPDGSTLSGLRLYATALKHMAFRLKPAEYPRIDTEVMRVAFGPVEILGLPGELLPELYQGGYDGRYRFGYPVVSPANPSPPDLSKAPMGPYLKDLLRGRHRFVIGLANDEIGYILPAYDFKTNHTLLMRPFPPGHHYEESNSVGQDAAARLGSAVADLLAP